MLQAARVSCQGKETKTLADGSYVLRDLQSGKHKVAASLEGFKSLSKSVMLAEGKDAVQDFKLAKASGTAKICGHVYDAESKKIIDQNGTVVLILRVANRYKHIDMNGYYEFENLPKGKYTVSASIQGYDGRIVTQSIADGEKKTVDLYCRPIRAVEPSWG